MKNRRSYPRPPADRLTLADAEAAARWWLEVAQVLAQRISGLEQLTLTGLKWVKDNGTVIVSAHVKMPPPHGPLTPESRLVSGQGRSLAEATAALVGVLEALKGGKL